MREENTFYFILQLRKEYLHYRWHDKYVQTVLGQIAVRYNDTIHKNKSFRKTSVHNKGNRKKKRKSQPSIISLKNAKTALHIKINVKWIVLKENISSKIHLKILCLHLMHITNLEMFFLIIFKQEKQLVCSGLQCGRELCQN